MLLSYGRMEGDSHMVAKAAEAWGTSPPPALATLRPGISVFLADAACLPWFQIPQAA